MKRAVENKMLTETELELMTILWRLEEGSVRDVMGELNEGRDLAYTSVSTILRILEKKEVVQSRKEGKTHIYSPIITKSTYEQKTLQHMLSNVFSQSPSNLVQTLLNSESLTETELEKLKELINNKEV